MPRALKHLVPCFRQAMRAADGLLPPRGPVAGVWRTDPITVDDMKRTLRAHGLAKWIGRFAKHAPIGNSPTALVLEIDTREGFPGYPFDWHLYAEPEAGSRKTMIDYRMQTDHWRRTRSSRRHPTRTRSSVRTGRRPARRQLRGRLQHLPMVSRRQVPHADLAEDHLPAPHGDPGGGLPARPVHDRQVQAGGLTAGVFRDFSEMAGPVRPAWSGCEPAGRRFEPRNRG